jgi:aldose 1-epimerase
VTYTFDKNNTLSIDYLAVSNRDTPVNLTNHAYFNLAGVNSGEPGAMAQTLRINAESITRMDDEYIPTGHLLPVENTPLDLRKGAIIGARLDSDHPQMRIAGGYDVNYAVSGGGLREAAVLACPQNGVTMRLFITNPGLQFYSGNMIGGPFARHGAVCLEPQHYPDSVHHAHFPSAILKAGERYKERSEYQFSAEKPL